jgi:ubiquinone/menaquinone biosynthesis C-methylase UbiE
VGAVAPHKTRRARAAPAAASSPVPVKVVAGHGDALPLDDASFDAAVVSLVLCSVPEPRHFLGEVRRVLKTGGELRFFEHVRSASPLLGVFQDAITPLWSAIGGGCHLNRDSCAAIEVAGFEIDDVDRFTYAPLKFVPPHAHILGRARKPAGTS